MSTVAQLLASLGLERPPPRLTEALTHPSFAREHGGSHYRGLSAAGDPVLQLAIIDRLFRTLPTLDEGELALRRNEAASAPTVAETARRIGLGGHLRVGAGGEKDGARDSDRVLAAAYQAVLGAICTDPTVPVEVGSRRALRAARLTHSWAIDDIGQNFTGGNWRNELVAWAHHLGLGLEYRTLSAGPDHKRRFHASAVVGGETLGEAPGRTKSVAEMLAAQRAVVQYRQAFGRSEPAPKIAPTPAKASSKKARRR